MKERRNIDARVSFDGQSTIELKAGDNVIIRHKSHQLQLMHPKDYDYNYYHILRNKLGWSVGPDKY